jgi:hypothetical protein
MRNPLGVILEEDSKSYKIRMAMLACTNIHPKLCTPTTEAALLF